MILIKKKNTFAKNRVEIILFKQKEQKTFKNLKLPYNNIIMIILELWKIIQVTDKIISRLNSL